VSIHQTINNRKGEIEFRKKLTQQQVEGLSLIDNEFNLEEIKNILNERMLKTFEQIKLIKEKGNIISPYIEIGAERGQRSLVMENDLMAEGAAVDISFDMLKSCDYYHKEFGKEKMPLRICCDANNLPFLSNSIPFIFTYETLHHFPSPEPIIKEVHRVSKPGGSFFFDEESFIKVLHLNLYKGKKNFSKEKLTQNYFMRVLDFFFAEMDCNEVDHGIIENINITLSTWKKSLSPYIEKEIKIESVHFFKSSLFNPRNYLKYFINYLLGGSISGICKKSGKDSKKQISIREALICPSCMDNHFESKLTRKESSYSCIKCNNTYPFVDGVLFLFSDYMFKELYPEIFNLARK
jgi:SAM-dependent methyltransferase